MTTAIGLLAIGLVAAGLLTAGRPGVGSLTPLAHAEETPAAVADPLPSWNDGPVKQAILSFVAKVTDETADTFVPVSERIATFDNDGTLWVEQPMYVQLTFALDRVKALAAEHPEWKTRQPFQSVLDGNMKGVAATGEKGLLAMVLATHAGMSADQFERSVMDWLATAKHPRFQQLYTKCVYQPQLELLSYLRSQGFKTFIVSGGGIEFMRPWSEQVYGIPPDQVVGSSVATEFQMRDGKPVLMRLPKINFIDDKTGKPVGIYQHIGQRPILAFGNSDGDQQMLQYTTGVTGPSLGLVVHHTDAEREYAYDRDSHFGKLDKVLDMAAANNWIMVDMRRDWKTIFAFEE